MSISCIYAIIVKQYALLFVNTTFTMYAYKPLAVGLSIFLLASVLPLHAFAQTDDTFDYSYIISDEEMVAYQTMDQQDIQDFLTSKQSYLSTYFSTLDTGERLSIAEQIFRAAQNHHINPQFLLVLLQKEQSLIEEPSPTQNQLDWATGYGCLDGQACNERWRGIYKQIPSAAEQFRYYYDHIDEYSYQPGRQSTVDGITVSPKNRVTAALYNYTPHLHGNKLFQALWQRYFVSILPDTTLVQVPGEAGVWLIKDSVRHAFTSRLALVSRYDPKLVVPITKTDLELYPEDYSIDFPAYSLVKAKTSGSIYLLTVDQKRLITSPDVFKNLGFNPEEVEDITDEAASVIPDGRPISLSDAYPTGALLQDKKTKEIFYVESGRRYPILDKAIMQIDYPTMKTSLVASDTLSKYPSGFPVLLRDGVLVKGSGPDVYVISNGKKRHVTSEKVFTTIGYKWSNIITTSDAVLDLHPTGDPIIVK